ncbi:MAG TPA: S8 family serine peptidase [Lysobacter sp.]
MRQTKLAGLLGIGLATMIVAGAATAAQPDANRVLVKFKPGAKAGAQKALQAAGARYHYTFDDLHTFAVTVPAKALQGLRNNPNIEYVETDAPRYATAQSVPYGIDNVQARDVWDANRDGTIDAGAPTGSGIKVCVIDSGINAAHEDFAGIAMTGYPAGWNADTCGHGTHVAGTIAATNNATGVVGVSPGKVSLHIVKVFSGYTCAWTYASTLVDAANRCQTAGAKVINMSLGGGGKSKTEERAFAKLDAAGILSVAAAGNDGNTTYSYPASYPTVVSVANVDSASAWAPTSQYNNAVDIAAPGTDILSTYPIYFNPLLVGAQSYAQNVVEGASLSKITSNIVDGGRCAAAGNWTGKIVLCERGDISFLQKTDFVIAGGGVGVVIYNNVEGELHATLGDGVSRNIPAVGISQADGQAIVASGIGGATTLDAIPQNSNTRYALLSGTSMASPHVAGAAALIWSASPTKTNAQVRSALLVTAKDIGDAGYDNKTGWGLLQAKDAVTELTK